MYRIKITTIIFLLYFYPNVNLLFCQTIKSNDFISLLDKVVFTSSKCEITNDSIYFEQKTKFYYSPSHDSLEYSIQSNGDTLMVLSKLIINKHSGSGWLNHYLLDTLIYQKMEIHSMKLNGKFFEYDLKNPNRILFQIEIKNGIWDGDFFIYKYEKDKQLIFDHLVYLNGKLIQHPR